MVSVIILVFNRCAEALNTIQSIKRTAATVDFPIEIIVVDNASTDGTATSIKQRHPDITFIHRTVNNGIAGWNDGFAKAKYPYYLVLDDDSHIHAGLPEAIMHMESHPEVGILGLQIVDEKLQMDPHLDPEQAWKDGEDIAGFIGCGAVIRKEVYERIGGFAEWLFVYTHEFEYAIRCLDAGFKVQFFSKGLVVHRASVINRTNRRLRVFGTRNELAIVYKYFSKNKLKYLNRIILNNLKFIKREGLQSGFYVLQGLNEFRKLKKSLSVTPVKQVVQNYYASKFWATKPVLSNLKKRFF